MGEKSTPCSHCGIEIEGACGHPATPAPCWTPEQVAEFERQRAITIARAQITKMAEELCSVQPMPESAMRFFTDDDPLVHALLSNFIARAQGKPLPYQYRRVPPYPDITRDIAEGRTDE